MLKTFAVRFCFSAALSVMITSFAVGQQNPDQHHLGHEGHDHQTDLAGLQVMGALDMAAFANSDRALTEDNRLQIRSAELMLSGPVDRMFDAVIGFAGHSHGGSFLWDLHEGYLQTSTLLPNTKIRAGKFLLGIGRLNRMHQHEWLFTEAPKLHREFFAEEAAIDTGLELTHSFQTERPMTLTVGLTNGYCYGHCDQLGRKPVTPLHYVRWGIGQVHGQTGLNYWGYTDFAGERVWHTGVDYFWQRKVSRRLTHLVHIETYYRNRLPKDGIARVDAGMYGLYQRSIAESWTAGVRLDLLSELNRRWELVDERRENLDYGLNLNATFKASEASTLRWGLTREVETQRGQAAHVNDRAEFQLVYLLGSHPEHDH